MTTIRIRPPTTNIARTQLVSVRRGAVAALFVAAPLAGALLSVPAPAQADPMLPLAPACDQYGFTGDVQLRQSNGWNVSFSSTGPVASGPATATGPGGAKMHGTISGGIQGRNVDLTIRWDNGPRGHYTGTVGNDVHLSGNSVDEANPGSTATYRSTFPIGCITPAAGPAPQKPPEQPKTATVVGEAVDVYNIAHGDVPDENGVVGVKIGELQVGQQVQLGGPCKPEDWCKVLVPELPGGSGFVWGHLQF
ncbi:MAG TPA: hypothetical protein VHI10_19305 [Mycobacterium sp.]|nr:hypothetical protein [Mycobacterium sp.]